MINSFFLISKTIGINAYLILSICSVETNLKSVNNFTDKNEASMGICQIQLTTARSLISHIDMLALQQNSVNINIAALYIKKLHKKYGNYSDTIAAYNAGRVKKINGRYVNYKYVDKVLEKIENTEI